MKRKARARRAQGGADAPPVVADKSRHTAVHEAGHAVAAAALGIMPSGVSILPCAADASAGRTVADDSAGTAHQKAVWSYAGHAAVVEFLGRATMSDSSARLHGAGRDFTEARALLRRDEVRMRYAKSRAAVLIRRYRPVVEGVTELLLRHDTFDGQLIDMMVAAHRSGSEGTATAFLEHLIREYGVSLPRGAKTPRQAK